MSRSRRALFVPLLVLTLCMVRVCAQQGSECTLVGEVHVGRSDFPSKRLMVNLETRGATTASTYTDSEGRFTFTHLEGNLYHVVINDEDYLPYRESIALTPVTSPIGMLRVDLVPRNDPRASTAGPTSLGANAHMMDSSSQHKDTGKALGGTNPNLVNPEDYSRRYSPKAVKEFEAGKKADSKGRADDAIAHYLKALTIDPAFYPAHINLGADYLNRSDFKGAEGEFQAAVRQNPSDAAAYFNLGNVQMITQRYADASASIQQGLQREPNSALGLFLRGTVLQKTSHGAEAEKDLLRALEIDPSLAMAHLALVNTYLQQKRKPDAIAQLQQFLVVAPNSAFAPKAREVLGSLQAEASTSRN